MAASGWGAAAGAVGAPAYEVQLHASMPASAHGGALAASTEVATGAALAALQADPSTYIAGRAGWGPPRLLSPRHCFALSSVWMRAKLAMP